MTVAPRVLIAHPSPDVYGSDRQLLVTVDALLLAGWQVKVCLPETGPLVELLAERNVAVQIVDFPVLRKALLNPRGLATLVGIFPTAVVRLSRLIRHHRPDVVLVNTVTIPVWLAAATTARVPAVCHVHEADVHSTKAVAIGIAMPMRLARTIVANSAASRVALLAAIPALASKITVVHNGVPGPPTPPTPARSRRPNDPLQVVLVSRLSARKGVDLAVKAVHLLAAGGRAVSLTIAGSAFRGYEDFAAHLLALANGVPSPGAVQMVGYVDSPWDLLADADVVVMPSLGESFGNAAVEGQLAHRPVVASAIQGLLEIVEDERTGLSVPPGDVEALAAAIARLADDPALAEQVAEAGYRYARLHFGTDVYGARMVQVMSEAAAT